jgi:peptide/nickel transport system permease protein
VATTGSSDFSLDAAGAVAAAEGERAHVEGYGPWRLGARRLRRNHLALLFAVVLGLVVAACASAPLYATYVAERDPNRNGLTDVVVRDGKRVDVVAEDGRPIGPALERKFLLGADANGRDVMVRLLYGGRNSLAIALTAAGLTAVLAVALGLAAGYFRGWVDRGVSSLFDVMWSFPVLLFAIALGTALALGGLDVGPFEIEGDSLWIPAVILGLVYTPYLGRPIRGQVLSLREKEFVESAVAQGMGPVRIMFGEVLPNVSSTILVFGTLIVANNILTEAALSFLGAGVQPPNPSWGNLIADGVERLTTAPHLALVPGAAIVLTVLALNVVGDGLRDALDPRAKVRLR